MVNKLLGESLQFVKTFGCPFKYSLEMESNPLSDCAVRKGYHIIALLLFLPALALEPELLAVALAVAFAGLLSLEAVRVGGVPRLSKALTGFMTAFTDARDGGVLFITHLALLVGMAAPIWVAVLSKQGAADPSGAALAGLLILGEDPGLGMGCGLNAWL